MMIALRSMALLLAAVLAATLAVAQDQPQLNLPVAQLQAGMHNIRAQVARSVNERSTGLMHRKEMPQHEGMLFIFEQPSVQCFWMRNTLLPLSIAFVEDDGTIVNIREMQPLDEQTRHCSDKPVRYVLEMNQGWFAKRAIKPGFKLTGAPFAPRQ
jgi:uncharacterized membrane protein (UPF0127 family)